LADGIERGGPTVFILAMGEDGACRSGPAAMLADKVNRYLGRYG